MYFLFRSHEALQWRCLQGDHRPALTNVTRCSCSTPNRQSIYVRAIGKIACIGKPDAAPGVSVELIHPFKQEAGWHTHPRQTSIPMSKAAQCSGSLIIQAMSWRLQTWSNPKAPGPQLPVHMQSTLAANTQTPGHHMHSKQQADTSAAVQAHLNTPAAQA